MGVTYNAAWKTIIVEGYSAVTPCTFQDIYDADVAGGWGVVTKIGNTYLFDCTITIGQGATTYFTDFGLVVVFKDGTSSGWGTYFIQSYIDSVVNFGNLVDEVTHKVGKGIVFINDNLTYGGSFLGMSGEVNYYGCTFMGILSSTVSYAHRVWGCMVQAAWRVTESPGMDIWNTTFINNAAGGIRPRNITTTYTFIRSIGNSYAVHLENMPAVGNLDIRNLWARNCVYLASGGGPGAGYYIRIIDADVDSKIVSGNFLGTIYRSWTHNLLLTDSSGSPIQGASVVMSDKNGELFNVTTDENGEIAEQIINEIAYQGFGQKTYLNPFTVVIIKPESGYQPLTIKFDHPATPMNMMETLQDFVPSTAIEVEVAVNEIAVTMEV